MLHLGANFNKQAVVSAKPGSQKRRLSSCRSLSFPFPTPCDFTHSSPDICLHPNNGIEEHFTVGRCIGTGSFGNVFKGCKHGTDREVAIKVLPKIRGKFSKAKTLEKIRREVQNLSYLQGAYGIVKLEACFDDDNYVYLVTELCGGGDLSKVNEVSGPFEERLLAHIAYEVLNIIKSCHDRGILHGDVKPANFVLKQRTYDLSRALDIKRQDGGSWLVAVDFGCSQNLKGRLSKRCGTPVYMSPETFRRDYAAQADIWSLGVMLYELFADRVPFWEEGCAPPGQQLDAVMEAVSTSDIPFNYGPWRKMTSCGTDFIRGCLQRDENDRLTLRQALDHSWFKSWGLENKKVLFGTNNIVPGPLLSSPLSATKELV